MLRALTKVKGDGTPYTRRPHVEGALQKLGALDIRDILERLKVVDQNDPRYVPSECVVYFLRDANLSRNPKVHDAFLRVLRNRAALAFRRAIRGRGSHEETLR